MTLFSHGPQAQAPGGRERTDPSSFFSVRSRAIASGAVVVGRLSLNVGAYPTVALGYLGTRASRPLTVARPERREPRNPSRAPDQRRCGDRGPV